MIECAKHPTGMTYPAWADGTADDAANAGNQAFPRYVRCTGVTVGDIKAFGDVTVLHRNGGAGELAFVTAPMDGDTLAAAMASVAKYGHCR